MGRLQDQQDGQIVDLGGSAPHQRSGECLGDQRIKAGVRERLAGLAQPVGVRAAEHGPDPGHLGYRQGAGGLVDGLVEVGLAR
jgi:hypothetical protein